MPEHGVAILHQRVEHLQQRAALIAGWRSVRAVLDPPVERQEARHVTVLGLQLIPDVPQRMRRSVDTLPEMPRQLPQHTDPLAERRQRQLRQQTIQRFDARATPTNLI